MCLGVSFRVCQCIMYVQCLHWPEKVIGLLEKRVIESEFRLGIKSRSSGRRVSSLNGASRNGCTASLALIFVLTLLFYLILDAPHNYVQEFK